MGSQPLREARLVQLDAFVEAARRVFGVQINSMAGTRRRYRWCRSKYQTLVKAEESAGAAWTSVDGVFRRAETNIVGIIDEGLGLQLLRGGIPPALPQKMYPLFVAVVRPRQG